MKRIFLCSAFFTTGALSAHPGHEKTLIELLQAPFAGIEHFSAAVFVAAVVGIAALAYAGCKRRHAD